MCTYVSIMHKYIGIHSKHGSLSHPRNQASYLSRRPLRTTSPGLLTPTTRHVALMTTVMTTTLRPQLGDFAARPSTCARGLSRQLSDHSSGISPLAPRPVLRDCLDHSLTTARGLCVLTTCDWQLAYSWVIFSWTLLQGSYLAFQQARGLHRYDAPAGASCIACTTIGFST